MPIDYQTAVKNYSMKLTLNPWIFHFWLVTRSGLISRSEPRMNSPIFKALLCILTNLTNVWIY